DPRGGAGRAARAAGRPRGAGDAGGARGPTGGRGAPAGPGDGGAQGGGGVAAAGVRAAGGADRSDRMSAPATLYDVLSVLEPPPALTVSQWADAHRRLPIGASAEPGPWRTAREPFQRGIMDAAHEGADTIVLMKSAQVGATECLLNLIGYFLAHDPAPILLIEPTEGLVKRIAKRRLWPMLSATPAITVRIAPRQGRRASSALLQVLFPGGSLTLVGANSATPLASDPIRIVLADEIDKYPATLGDEGDPLALGLARTKRFWNRLHVLTSTPTRMGASRIEREYLASDQRRYFVPCPRCGEPFVLAWRHVHWTGGRTGDPAT